MDGAGCWSVRVRAACLDPVGEDRRACQSAGVRSETGIQWWTVVRLGDPAEEIMNLARESGSNLMVLGRQESGATRFPQGSVSEQVPKNADCDVLVVCSRSASEALGRSSAAKRIDMESLP